MYSCIFFNASLSHFPLPPKRFLRFHPYDDPSEFRKWFKDAIALNPEDAFKRIQVGGWDTVDYYLLFLVVLLLDA